MDNTLELLKEMTELCEKQIKSLKLIGGLTDVHLYPQIQKIKKAKAHINACEGGDA